MSGQPLLSNLFAWSLQVGLLTAVASLTIRLLRVTAPSIRPETAPSAYAARENRRARAAAGS